MKQYVIGLLCALTIPTFASYITKWEFVELCQHAYDPETSPEKFALSFEPGGVTFDPKDVQPGDCIFLRGRHADTFFETLVPAIEVPFIIISHGERYDGFKESYLPYLENDKVIAWFSTHACQTPHPKFHTIPLGFKAYPEYYAKKSENERHLKKLSHQKKKRLIYANFSSWTDPERKKLNRHLSRQSFCTHRSNKIPFTDYLKEMGNHRFTFSPRGIKLDCYRTWEALLVGSIPVILHSWYDYMYKDLPVVLVNSWKEVTPEFLEKTYKEMKHTEYDLAKLSIDYWKNEINHVKQDYFAQQAISSQELL